MTIMATRVADTHSHNSHHDQPNVDRGQNCIFLYKLLEIFMYIYIPLKD